MRTNAVKVLAIALLVMSIAPSAQAAVRKPNKNVTVTKRVVVTPSRVEYNRPKPVVTAVRVLPSSAVVVKHKGVSLHFCDGIFYRRDSDRYVVVAAPVGFRVKVLPRGYRLINLAGRNYYYFEGTYYIKSGSSYEVVAAPHDGVVYTLPAEADHVRIDGEEYYIYNGVIYSIITTPEGRAFKACGEIDGR